MAVVFPTTALRWKKSNLHQHKTESAEKKYVVVFLSVETFLENVLHYTCIVIVKSEQRVS